MLNFFEQYLILIPKRTIWANVLRIAIPVIIFSIVSVVVMVGATSYIFPEMYPFPFPHILIISPIITFITASCLVFPIVYFNIKVVQKFHIQENLTREANIKANKIIEQRSRFVAYIGHEIRNPLNGIMGITRTLEDSELTPIQLEKLNVIKSSSDDLLNILNDILDMSKVDSGALKLHPRPMDLQKIIVDIKDFWASRAQVNDLRLELKIAENFPRFVKIDASRFRQVANNLISNAIKYTEKGSIQIKAQYDEKNQSALIFVKDTGRGIPDTMHNAIFDPYFQVPEADDISIKLGTGLGLPIARQLALQMGGDVKLIASSRKGSQFVFSLHLDIIKQPDPEKIHFPVDSGNISGKTVLVVDDLATNRFVASTMLQKLGMKITTAENGTTALDILGKQKFDVILLDELLGDMSGIDVFLKTKKTHPNARFIAYSGSDPEMGRERFMALGFDGFAAKPLIFQLLCEEVVNVFLTQWKNLPASTPAIDG